MAKRNYDVCLHGGLVRFAYRKKSTAVVHARSVAELRETWQSTYVQSARTGQKTYILHKDGTSCNICGCELDSKVHCPNCNALHTYL